MSFIHLQGVRVHNLRSIDAAIPLGQWTVITGVSGAGKSSLAFDTLHAEAQRRYLQGFSASTRQLLEKFDRPDADHIGDLPPAIAVSRQELPRHPRATVGTVTEILDYLRLLFTRAAHTFCLKCNREVKSHTPEEVWRELAALGPGTRLTLGFPRAFDQEPTEWVQQLQEEGFLRVQAGSRAFRLDEPWPADLPEFQEALVLLDRVEVGRSSSERILESLETAFRKGDGRLTVLLEDRALDFDQRRFCSHCQILYPAPEPRLLDFNDPQGACPTCEGTGFQGNPQQTCPTCQGSRLGEFAGCYRFGGQSIAELSRLGIAALLDFLREFQAPNDPGTLRLVEQVQSRLGILQSLELGYLSLDRWTGSLAVGEARRVRMTAVLGANLVQALYVLDEPSLGFHPRNVARLLEEFRRLRRAGNTLVIVDHDPQILRAADWIIDLGPGAGEEGGRVVFQGPTVTFLASSFPMEEEGSTTTLGEDRATGLENSLTADYLRGRVEKRSLGSPRRPTGKLRLENLTIHNLRDVTVEFPLGVLCVVSGVSGAGKTTLLREGLYAGWVGKGPKLLGKTLIGDVVLMDQDPLHASARSNPATYLKVFDDIRKVFADTTEAKIRNFTPGHFSFNQPGGRCEICQGQGRLEIDMQFLADVAVTCPECLGKRFRRDLLQVKVRGLDISQVLDLTVREAFRFFRAQPMIERRLKILIDVGLEYLRLGQPLDTVSGGEGQRLKLAGHLASNRKARTLFLLLEPSAGLHPADVDRLLDCFNQLLATGHSLIVVDYRQEVLAAADWIIELGPGGGPAGGRIMTNGPRPVNE